MALLLSYLPGIKVIYHEHDSPTSGVGGFFRRVCLAARFKLAYRAAMNVLPNERRVESFTHEMGGIKNVVCVWNCPMIEEVGPPREILGTETLRVLYHGSIVPSRLPLTVIEALALLPANVKLRIIGYETVGHLGYVEELKVAALKHGVESQLEILRAIPRYELLNWCRKSDVGLAFMPMNSSDLNEQSMVGASNKPFDYLSSGLALLVPDLADWRAVFVNAGYASTCDVNDAQSIASALRWFLEHPEEMRLMGERGRQIVATAWNYERQFRPVFEQLSAGLTTASGDLVIE